MNANAPSSGFSFTGLSTSRAAALEFFYGQFGQVLTTIGSVIEALDLVRGQIQNSAVESAVGDVRRVAASGMSIANGMRLRRDVFADDHIQLIEAGESGGTLPDACRRIAGRIEHTRKMQREWRGALAYPLLLIHGVAFVQPIGLLGTGVGIYLGRALLNVAIIWGIAFAVYVVWRRTNRHGDLTKIPLLGRIFHTMRAGSLCWSLGSLYEAGVTLVTAVEGVLPPQLRDDPRVAAAVSRLRRGDGEGFAGFVADSTLFPQDTVRIMTIAQESGSLGEALMNEGARLEELGVHRMKTTLRVTGRTIYIIAALVVAYTVIRFYASYFGAIGAI